MTLALGNVTATPHALMTRTQWLGVGTLGAVILFAILQPLVFPADPLRQNLQNSLGTGDGFSPLGYDHFGRSMTARLATALRLSLSIAFAAVLISACIGVLAGMVAAWRGGWIARGLTLVSDSVLALPALLMVLIVSAIVPSTPMAFWIGISAILWIEYFRLTHAIVARLLAAPSVQASRLLGFGPVYIFRRHVWPELAPLFMTVGAFGAATTIMTIAALGFVSVGVRAPRPELGLMMVELLPYYREAPHALLSPVVALFLTILGLNLIAGGRRT